MIRIFNIGLLLSVLLGGVLLPGPIGSQEIHQEKRIEKLIAEGEKWLYAFDVFDHLYRTEKVLSEIEMIDPNHPYIHWGRARVAFWKKEFFYILDSNEKARLYETAKLALSDECHTHSDRCIELAPKNAECHLMKGVCYAMQASTWGQSLKTLRVLKSMDHEFALATELRSEFRHLGDITTRDLGLILRGILFRLMPDSWWFRFFAGIRGNKENAYGWMKEGFHGRLTKEPVTVLEMGATSICYGIEEKKQKLIRKGTSLLENGLKLPSRYQLDDLDKRNMMIMIEHPEKACSYRRERFEEISQKSLEDGIRSDKD